MHFRSQFPSALLICCALSILPIGADAQGIACDPEPTISMNIEYGDSVHCTFDENDDLDSYQFFGAAGDRPYIQKRNSGNTAGTTLSSYLRLYAPSGDLIDGTLNCYTCSIDETLTETGIHTIVVEMYNPGNASEPYEYQLELPCLAGSCAVEPVPDSVLGYVAVNPCRIVDTRYGVGGAFSAGEIRHFRVYGDISDQNKAAGGAPANYPDTCPFPLGEPSAVQINLTVVPQGPAGQSGFATVWPWNETQPAASWINYVSGVQNIANSGTVATTIGSDTDPDISFFAQRNIHVIIDVLGYYTN